MSFLAEILASKGQAELEELNDKIVEINKHVLLLKEEVTVTMEDKYLNYTLALDDTNHLLNKVGNISAQIVDIQERIDNQIKSELASSKEHLETLKTALLETTFSFQLVDQLLKIDTALDAAQAADVKNNCKLLEIAQQLKNAEEDLKSNTSGLECLDIFDSMLSELRFHQTKHSYHTVKLWSQCFVWNESSVDSKSKTVTLTLATNFDKEELFKALLYYELLSFQIQEFSEKFYRDVLSPIILYDTHVDIEGSSLIVNIDLVKKRPACLNVLNNLTVVFNFLSIHLNLKSDDDVNFIHELKNHISEEFCSFFIKDCLSLTVPKKRSELEAYKVLVEEITAFEMLLKEIGFIDEEDKSIAEYATNVEELFTTKTCESYLAAARNIMKKDLHDIKQIGVVESDVPTDLSTTSSTVHLDNLSPYTFHFPSCQISKSTEELLELVEEILREVPRNTDSCAVRLFYTARNIFALYCDVVPEFHSRLLDSIPQQSALLHNNAMYLAHQLMFLGPRHRPNMPQVLEIHTPTFVDLVNTLRTLAADVLSKQLQKQKKHIIDILRDSGLVTLSDSPKFPDGVEKAIRQCLRQLALLQTVWQHVLPVTNYCKALGMLCNVFVEEIIQKVIAVEDISADTAAHLVVVFTLIQQKAPQVFPDPLEIHGHVKKWGKFCELKLVLGASLREVDDRWADGKGPLAQEFTAEQIRHLIRALFQISDRRAVLLAKII